MHANGHESWLGCELSPDRFGDAKKLIHLTLFIGKLGKHFAGELERIE
jgi:hypothetical protein